MSLIRIEDYSYPAGWTEAAQSAQRAQWCCEQLEDSQVLYFESIPFNLSADDIAFLLEQKDAKSASRKNISFIPQSQVLEGVDDSPSAQKLQQVMSRYSQGVTQFLEQVLSPYASSWKPGKASYRTEEEKGRDLKKLKRNDLIHTDALPSQPTNGARILRCLSNINPTVPRVWNTAESLPILAEKYARQVGFAPAGDSQKRGLLGALKSSLGKKEKQIVRSDYDAFMMRFHDFLKENEDFQTNAPKEHVEFAPNTTWMCFTDSVPHAAMSGRFALEHTFFIPQSALLHAEKSPLRVLEQMAGRSLTLQA